MEVTLLYFDGCPHWKLAAGRLDQLAVEVGADVSHRVVRTPEEASAVGFRGSPTILVDGRDPFAASGEATAFACRLYPTPDGPRGAPTVAQLREVLR